MAVNDSPLLVRASTDVGNTRRRGVKMSLRETLTLSPFQKWKRHGVLPTKLIVHLLVAFLSAFLQIMAAQDTASMLVETRKDLAMLLYPRGCTAQWRGEPQFLPVVPTCRVRDISELRKLLNRTVGVASNLEGRTVGAVESRYPDDHIEMQAWFADGQPSKRYQLTNATESASLGPLAEDSPWRSWLDSVERIELSFDLTGDMHLSSLFFPAAPTDSGHNGGSYWRVVVHLDPSTSRTSFLLDLRMNQHSPSSTPHVPAFKVSAFSLLAFLNVLSLLLAARSTVLALIRLVHLTERFEYAGRLHDSPTPGLATPMPSPPLSPVPPARPLSSQAHADAGREPGRTEPPVCLRPHLQRATTAPDVRDRATDAADASSAPTLALPSAHASGTARGTPSGLRQRGTSFSRRLSLTLGSATEVPDEAAWLANLHMEYPFLNSKRMVDGSSGDVVEDTMREARAWLRQPFHRRLASLLSFFVCLDAIGNICLLAYAWSNISNAWGRSVELFNPRSPSRGLSALGALCTWMGLIRYFGHSRRLTLVTTTLTVVASPIVWTMISVSPIFIGYALTGIQLFGNYAPGFTSISVASSTLWALMVGDEVNATFRQVSPVYPFLGRLYVYSFVGIFYLAVANIFIVLIESAYMISLQIHYKKRGAGSSKTTWSELGVEFARYARKVVSLSQGLGGVGAQGLGSHEPLPAVNDVSMMAKRVAALEASIEQQNSLLQRLLVAAGPPGASSSGTTPCGASVSGQQTQASIPE